jgi:immune inhibitor A
VWLPAPKRERRVNKATKWALTCLALFLASCACISILAIAGAGLVVWQQQPQESSQSQQFEPVQLPTRTPSPTLSVPALSTPSVGVASLEVAEETWRTLRSAEVPVNDPIQLAERLKGKNDIQPTLPAPARALQVGDEQKFWVTDSDTDEKRQVTATLRYITDHLYFWIEDGLSYSDRDMRRLADTFSEKIYPTDREFFGSEWNPGVDDDPRLHVLYVSQIGSTVAGYFSSADEVPPEAFEFSNAREMFVLSADNVSLGEEYIYGVMAHEFQHMIHYATDRNEESWMNEGFSVLAELLNGYDIGGFDYFFMQDPDLSLIHWPGPGESAPNYGASFLDYFLNRFGEQATQALVADPDNGMDSVDAVLSQLDEQNLTTGATMTADDVFADWAVANYLDDAKLENGRYYYQNYLSAPKASPTEEYRECPTGPQTRTVNQYGNDYVRLACRGDYTLTFQGNQQVALLPVDAYSGEYAFWSNKGDESDMTLTRMFDFSTLSGPITLTYRTWYDLESGYDYVYLLVSLDGQHWEQLKAPSGTDENPNGSNFGWGYNGDTGPVWIRESVDLSRFAGQKVQLRFEYITDAAVNGEGFLLDDVAVDAMGYQSNFENDDGGWMADGFVRVANALPQTFRVSLILMGGQTQVVPLVLDDTQQGSYSLSIGADVGEVILVVGGTARFTNQEAEYTFDVQ